MQIPHLMKRLISYLLIVLLLLQSCNSLYLPTTLQQSVDRGKVKITDMAGQSVNYERIAFNDGIYYGEKLNNINEPKSFLVTLDTNNIASLSYESKVYSVWLKMRDVVVEGVLYDINDSLISVGSSMKKSDYLSGNYTIAQYPISQVETIMIRPYGKMGAGAGIGFLSAAIVGGILYAQSDGDPFFLILIYLPFMALGTIIGTGIGAAKKSYNMDNYTSVGLNEELRKYCFK